MPNATANSYFGKLATVSDRTASAIVTFGLIFLLALVITQIVSRTIGWAITPTEEMTRYTLTTLAPYGFYPWRRDKDLLGSAPIGPSRSTWKPLIWNVAGAGALVILVCGTLSLALLAKGERISTINASMAWIYCLAGIGMAQSALALFLKAATANRR